MHTRTFQFSPAERMVFHRWQNPYRPTKDHSELFTGPWCPLFGVIPPDFPSEAAKIIRELRGFCGIPLSLSGGAPEANPDAKIISGLAGVPVAKIEAARLFFNNYNTEAPNVPTEGVETKALGMMARVWGLMGLYYISQKWEKDIFDGEFAKIAVIIAKNATEYAMEHAKCEQAPLLKSLSNAKMGIIRANQARTAPRRKKNEQQVKDYYLMLTRRQSIESISFSAVAKMIEADIPRPKLSLNTIKKHIQSLVMNGEITENWRKKP